MACVAGAVTGNAVASEYVWQLPPGFPPPSVHADNPMSTAKVELGCRLFFDTRLSVTGQYSCASCHRPELAFTDGRAQALGSTGEVVRRNAMTLTNVAYNPTYTWASKAITTLEADPSRRRRMGSAGRQRVVEHFAVETMSRKTADVYRSAVLAAANA